MSRSASGSKKAGSVRGGVAPGTEQVRAATRGEGAGLGEVRDAQPVESSAEVSEGCEAVEQAGGEGVSRADGVDDVDGRSGHGDAPAVEGREGAAFAEGDDDEPHAGGVAGVARLLGAGAGEEHGEVVLAEAEDVGQGAPAGNALAVGGGRHRQGTDVRVDGHGDALARGGEVARWSSIRLPPGSRISAGEPVRRQTVSS
jgi:hypothetical protein